LFALILVFNSFINLLLQLGKLLHQLFDYVIQLTELVTIVLVKYTLAADSH